MSFEDVWGSSPDDVYCVGRDGSVAHGSGTTWELVPVPAPDETWPGTDLSAIFGFGEDGVFAGGTGPTVLRKDGEAFTRMDLGNRLLRSVWAAPGGVAVYAVTQEALDSSPYFAYLGVASASFGSVGGQIEILDDSGWSAMDPPLPVPAHSVWGADVDDIFAAGQGGSIWRFDGAAWSDQGVAADDEAFSLCGNSATEVYALGTSGTVLHFDGASWEAIGQTGAGGLLWASSPSDVFVFAELGSSDYAVLHYDGAAWSEQDLAGPEILTGVWGSGPDDVWAVGISSYWGITGWVLHYDGVDWSPALSSIDVLYEAVGGSGPDDVYATAMDGRIIHYDGADWTEQTSPVIEPLSYVVEDGEGALHAASVYGTVLARETDAWTVVDEGVRCSWITSLWGPTADDLYATCFDGAVLHFDGDAWTETAYLTNQPLQAIWGDGSELFAVGWNETLLQYDGSVWTAVEIESEEGGWYELQDVWGSSATDVWAVGTWQNEYPPGTWGLVMYYDGSEWTASLESDFWLFDHVYGFGPDDVYAVGEAGGKIALWHFDGAAWQTVTTGIELQYPRALWGATPDDLYVVGSHGFIVRGPCE